MFGQPLAIDLPDHTFFDPTDNFLVWIHSRGRKILDVGAGVGQFVAEYQKRFPDAEIHGIDINTREGYRTKVHRVNAMDYHYDWTTLHTICRPDHSGWAEHAFLRMLDLGVEEIYYVGLQRNFEFDLLGLLYERVFIGAGKDGEDVWRILGVDEDAK